MCARTVKGFEEDEELQKEVEKRLPKEFPCDRYPFDIEVELESEERSGFKRDGGRWVTVRINGDLKIEKDLKNGVSHTLGSQVMGIVDDAVSEHSRRL